MPAARYQSDRFDGTGGAAENEAIARIRGTGAGLIDQVISSSLRRRRAFGYYETVQKVLQKNWSARMRQRSRQSHGC